MSILLKIFQYIYFSCISTKLCIVLEWIYSLVKIPTFFVKFSREKAIFIDFISLKTRYLCFVFNLR